MPDIDVDMEASTSGSSARGPTAVATDSQNSNHVVLTQSTKATSGGRFDPDDDIEDLNDSDEFDDPPEIMDEDSDIFSSGGAGQAVDITSNRRPHPLLPDDYGDEAMAAIRFSEEFTSRYGRPRPAFFPATLDDAIKESCMQPARDVSKLSSNHKMFWQLKHAVNIKHNIKPTTKLNILHHFSAKFSPCIYITIQAYLQMCFARRVSAQTLLYPSLTKTSFVLDGI